MCGQLHVRKHCDTTRFQYRTGAYMDLFYLWPRQHRSSPDSCNISLQNIPLDAPKVVYWSVKSVSSVLRTAFFLAFCRKGTLSWRSTTFPCWASSTLRPFRWSRASWRPPLSGWNWYRETRQICPQTGSSGWRDTSHRWDNGGIILLVQVVCMVRRTLLGRKAIQPNNYCCLRMTAQLRTPAMYILLDCLVGVKAA